ncbi:VTT domain-containing protein [Adlercreutzia aquisgranensis]|uniref:VTT domain-containing protein n=1 Tax=Adlercreutzia aquisgranensis TaxID=2941323 RepID=UPI00203DDAA9|nr:VTT domain-containing protein [Adlercreutzia aquisgranensis]
MAIIDFFVNLLRDPRGFIASWIIALGPVWVYSPLFLIVFVETGLVFFPFLPGDSLLFAAGVFSADGGGLHLGATLVVFYAAAILGNTSNYWIARVFGSRIIDSGKVGALTPERMAKLDHFFERYGGLTIVITRFMPFFRTFAPFIAGTGHMNFGRFTLWNVIGGVSWVSLFVLVGYFFGGVPFVQEHFEVIVIGIVAVSVAPAVVGAVKAALSSRKAKEGDPVAQAEERVREAEYDRDVVREKVMRAEHAARDEARARVLAEHGAERDVQRDAEQAADKERLAARHDDPEPQPAPADSDASDASNASDAAESTAPDREGDA